VPAELLLVANIAGGRRWPVESASAWVNRGVDRCEDGTASEAVHHL